MIIPSELRGVSFDLWWWMKRPPFSLSWLWTLYVTLYHPRLCILLLLLHTIMNGPSYRIHPCFLEALPNHWCNIAIEIWYPHWIPKRRPDQIIPSTTNFYVPTCGHIIWRFLPLIYLCPVIYLRRPSPDAKWIILRYDVPSSSFMFIYTPQSLPPINFQPLPLSSQ